MQIQQSGLPGFGAGQRFLFSSGSSIDFMLARPKILQHFRNVNCIDLIVIPPGMNNPRGADPMLAPFSEMTFEGRNPDQADYDKRVADYADNLGKAHDEEVQLLLNSGLDPSVIIRLRFDIDRERLKDESKVNEYKDKVLVEWKKDRETFESRDKDWSSYGKSSL